MTVKATYLADISGITLSEEDKPQSWVHALSLGAFKHPVYGTIDITTERVKNFVENVKNKVRGVDLSTNYIHGPDQTGDGEASGWIKDADARSDGLWVLVEWTTEAAKKIKEKAFKYFSSEFYDEWEDQTGKKHTDVLFGGGLTNRPYLKNLVPINLSEQSYEIALDLIELGKGLGTEGGNMPLSDEELDKIVNKLAVKLSERKPGVDPVVKKLTDIPELKALAEENPMVKALLATVESQNVNIADTAQKLKEAELAQKLSEFDRSKIVLTPVARQRVTNLMSQMPEELTEEFWTLLSEMKRSSAFLVELGESAGATVNYGSPKSAVKQFDEAAAKLMAETKITYNDAVERVASENPALYKRYRSEQFEGVNR